MHDGILTLKMRKAISAKRYFMHFRHIYFISEIKTFGGFGTENYKNGPEENWGWGPEPRPLLWHVLDLYPPKLTHPDDYMCSRRNFNSTVAVVKHCTKITLRYYRKQNNVKFHKEYNYDSCIKVSFCVILMFCIIIM